MTGSRLFSLDLIRGVAVLGILLLNIVSFAMPEAAYTNPRAYGGWHGADLAVWLVNFLLFDGRMRGLFSFLFGASMLTMAMRAEAAGADPAGAHYRRLLWLLAFGVAHLLLVWHGDILAHYAMIGMFAFLFRKLSVPRLMAMGMVLLLVEMLVLGAIPVAIAQALATPMAADSARTLADYQQAFGTPSASAIAAELALWRGSYSQILSHRLAEDAALPFSQLVTVGPETLAYMFFGMAALRSGLFTGEWPRAELRRWAAIGFGIGVPAYALLAAVLVWQQFGLFSVALCVELLTVPLRPVMILGWVCLILLAGRPGEALAVRIACAGRMAFTNYLATSLICTTLFYGYGLGWFGALSRAALYPLVLMIWIAILGWSKPWLLAFRYGPLEWLWRSLARGRLQPMRIANASH